MSSVEPQPLPEFHPAHWAALTDQRHRMMDVRSVLACARCALMNDHTIDIHGSVCLAHETLNDIIDKLDGLSLDEATRKWLTDREKPSTDE